MKITVYLVNITIYIRIINSLKVTLQMASQPGSNPNGEFQGFRLQWATEGQTTFEDLKTDINTFAQAFNLYVYFK